MMAAADETLSSRPDPRVAGRSFLLAAAHSRDPPSSYNVRLAFVVPNM
jgi:hypothetical protein